MNGTAQNGGSLPNKLVEYVVRTPGREPSPQPTHLSVPGSSIHRTLSESGTGYVAPKFDGKEKQMEEVIQVVEEKGFIPEDLVESETRWFYTSLGADDMYFATETPEVISNHVHSLYAAKVAAFARDDKRLEIRLDKEAADHAVYIDTSIPGVSNKDGPGYEARLEAKYLDVQNEKSYRVESFRSTGKLSEGDQNSLRGYFVYQCSFPEANPGPNETRLELIADKKFLTKATKKTLSIYQEMNEIAVSRHGPVIEVYDIESSHDKRLVVAFRQRTCNGFFSSLSDLYHYYGLTSTRKYVEQFANGITVMSVYLTQAPGIGSNHPSIEDSIEQIIKEVSLLYCLPRNRFQDHFATGKLSLQEATFAHSVWVFTTHFVNRLGPEYDSLASELDVNNSAHSELLAKIKRRLRNETFTSDYILEVISMYPSLIHALYLNFANRHYVQVNATDTFLPTLSYLRLQVDKVRSDEELGTLIGKTVANEHHAMIMSSFRVFTKHLLKTNFFQNTKVALSFRFDPSFLPKVEYPTPLYGMFLVVASEFRGFHLRFKDVARGGIRIVTSRTREAYAINARSLFDENYNLALAQNRKNKDIPEFGSKGTILVDWRHQDPQKLRIAFEKYVDSIIDLLLPASSPGIKNPIVDLYGRAESLFCGPDENTSNMVDWATEHARARGAPWWKSFFTGKSPNLGGIPHDTYGMTTLSVREYVNGVYRKLHLDPSTVRKLQTGGPDGDLGSNEILLGNEKYGAVVDGSGVLVDPEGINSDELRRLAKGRKMIVHFDALKLSPKGYRVLVEDTDCTLPTGEVVSNGMTFRNTFHLRAGAYDMFVPCGGRPESIDISSVSKLIEDGKSSIPYICEGANLFLTQDARLRLEKAGCVIFKDASANKGGVTSSSLEVLASLAFDDASFVENMCVKTDGTVPQFYKDYVRAVQDAIKHNAAMEFEAIWRENEETGVPRSILSDRLSLAINSLNEELQKSQLWDDLTLRRSVLMEALPNILLEKIGYETIIERIPSSYLRSIFGSFLASHFVYEYGTSASQFKFYDFMTRRTQRTAAALAA